MADQNWVHQGDLKLLKRSYQGGNWNAPYDVLEYCRMEKKGAVPAWALDAILDDYKHGRVNVPTRKGRAARIEERHKQLLSDGMCFLLVERLVHEGHNQTQAEAETARRLNLSPITVHKARKRMKARYLRADQHGGWMQI